MAKAAEIRLPLRIGTLSALTGVTVRALHHYDALGLLKAPHRTAAGHRLYGRREITRLQQIRSLQQLGLSLADIHTCFVSCRLSPAEIVTRHLARARARLRADRDLVRRLEVLARRLAGAGEVPIEQFIQTLEATIMTESYFTEEEDAYTRQRLELVGEARIRHVEAHEWPTLIAEVQAEMQKGTDPSAPVVKALAARWKALVQEFTGGHAGVGEGIRRQYQEQSPNPAERQGMPLSPEMFQYIGRAMKG